MPLFFGPPPLFLYNKEITTRIHNSSVDLLASRGPYVRISPSSHHALREGPTTLDEGGEAFAHQTLATHPLHSFSVREDDEPLDDEMEALSSLSSSDTSISNHDALGPPSCGTAGGGCGASAWWWCRCPPTRVRRVPACSNMPCVVVVDISAPCDDDDGGGGDDGGAGCWWSGHKPKVEMTTRPLWQGCRVTWKMRAWSAQGTQLVFLGVTLTSHPSL